MTTLLLTIGVLLVIPGLTLFALLCRIIYLNRGLFMDGPEDE